LDAVHPAQPKSCHEYGVTFHKEDYLTPRPPPRRTSGSALPAPIELRNQPCACPLATCPPFTWQPLPLDFAHPHQLTQRTGRSPITVQRSALQDAPVQQALRSLEKYRKSYGCLAAHEVGNNSFGVLEAKRAAPSPEAEDKFGVIQRLVAERLEVQLYEYQLATLVYLTDVERRIEQRQGEVTCVWTGKISCALLSH
jgi:hypothetical protein